MTMAGATAAPTAQMSSHTAGLSVGEGAGLAGRVVLITGGTAGIGYETARGLARRGAELLLVGRSVGRGTAAAAALDAETGRTAARFLAADLSVQAEVHRLAAAVRDATDRLDVLINNAGALFGQRQLSADGIEMTWALNHLAPFLLTHLVLDLLDRAAAVAAPARVITVASAAHKGARIRWADPQLRRGYHVWLAYKQSKLANLLFTFACAQRLDPARITANAVHPGLCASDIATANAAVPMFLWRLAARWFARSCADGARSPIAVASDPGFAAVTGAYVVDERPVAPDPAARDQQAMARLWALSAAQTGIDPAAAAAIGSATGGGRG